MRSSIKIRNLKKIVLTSFHQEDIHFNVKFAENNFLPTSNHYEGKDVQMIKENFPLLLPPKTQFDLWDNMVH